MGILSACKALGLYDAKRSFFAEIIQGGKGSQEKKEGGKSKGRERKDDQSPIRPLCDIFCCFCKCLVLMMTIEVSCRFSDMTDSSC